MESEENNGNNGVRVRTLTLDSDPIIPAPISGLPGVEMHYAGNWRTVSGFEISALGIGDRDERNLRVVFVGYAKQFSHFSFLHEV